MNHAGQQRGDSAAAGAVRASDDGFAVPRAQRYFEDYQPGSVHEYGPLTVTERDIVAFGRQFDPQFFHTDPVAAQDGPYGGLIASGWHTTGLMTRLFVDHYLSSVASLGGPGVDELRWHVPVRPGDVLRLRATVVEARPSRSKPDRGLVRTRVEMINQRGETAMSLVVMNLLLRRDTAGPAGDGT